MNSLAPEEIVFNILEGIFSDIEIEEDEKFNKFPRTINSSTFVETMEEKEAFKLINSVNYKKMIKSIDNDWIDYNYNSDQFLDDLHKTTPPSFLIIGSSNVSQREIAEIISKEYKCVHVTKEQLIHDEIQRGTIVGKWIDLNLKLNKKIPFQLILQFLEREVKRDLIQYRGYVLSEIPDISDYELSEELRPITLSQMDFFENIFDELILKGKLTKKKTEIDLDSTIGDSIENVIKYQLKSILKIKPKIVIYLKDNDLKYSEEISKFILHYPQENVLKIEKNSSIIDSIKLFMELKNIKKIYEAKLIDSQKNMPNSVFEKSCPVAFKYGRIIKGLPKYSIEFMNEKYFLSSNHAKETFIRNPTNYIKVLPPCRIAIIGPTTSGKSTIAKVFEKILVGKVVDVKKIFENAEIREREILYPEALNVVLKRTMEENFQNLDIKINEWKKNILETINRNGKAKFQ